MRSRIAAPLSVSLLLFTAAASSQVPGVPPPAQPGAPGPLPPPVWSPPGPQQPPGFALPMPYPSLPPPIQPALAPPPMESPPVEIAQHVGFGAGVWAAPIGGGGFSSLGAAGAVSGSAGQLGVLYGGILGIRWWARERVVVLPSLQLGISHTSQPPVMQSGITQQGSDFTSGLVSPAVSLGYALYRGKSTRFLIVGGLSFTYNVATTTLQSQTSDGTFVNHDEIVKNLSFAVPAGFGFEAFFTPRISIALDLRAPLFAYTSSKIGSYEASTTVGANFSSTAIGAAIFFYTD